MNWESVNKVELGGAVTLSGLVIVFIALTILIMAVILMGKLLGVKPKAKPQQPTKSAPPAASAPTTPPAMAVQGGIEEEIVAAISAAIAYTMQESAPGVAYAVTDIRRGSSVRPVWGFAGMQQNTRPF